MCTDAYVAHARVYVFVIVSIHAHTPQYVQILYVPSALSNTRGHQRRRPPADGILVSTMSVDWVAPTLAVCLYIDVFRYSCWYALTIGIGAGVGNGARVGSTVGAMLNCAYVCECVRACVCILEAVVGAACIVCVHACVICVCICVTSLQYSPPFSWLRNEREFELGECASEFGNDTRDIRIKHPRTHTPGSGIAAHTQVQMRASTQESST